MAFDSHKHYTLAEREEATTGRTRQCRIKHAPGAIYGYLSRCPTRGEVAVEATGNWIALRLSQPAPNVDAVGAWVEVRTDDSTFLREVTVGGGHAGGQLGWLHFGLGDADTAEVRVQWPDGEAGPWVEVPAEEFATIERGAAGAELWEPDTGDG